MTAPNELLRGACERVLIERLSRNGAGRYWLARLQLAGAILVASAITADPDSLSHSVIESVGVGGWKLIAVLTALAAVAVADVVVNDLMPARFRLCWAKRWRHLLYMAQAIALMSMVYVVVDAVGYVSVILFHVFNAAAAVAIAFLDLFARHRPGHRA